MQLVNADVSSWLLRSSLGEFHDSIAQEQGDRRESSQLPLSGSNMSSNFLFVVLTLQGTDKLSFGDIIGAFYLK
jgi:hypothetical protein